MYNCPILQKSGVPLDTWEIGAEICLNCPIPEGCIFDTWKKAPKVKAREIAKGITPLTLIKGSKRERDKNIIQDYADGLTGKALGEKYNLAMARVYEIIREFKTSS